MYIPITQDNLHLEACEYTERNTNPQTNGLSTNPKSETSSATQYVD